MATQKNMGHALVTLDPEVYAAARIKANACGATVTGVLRALLSAWIDAPTPPLIPGFPPPDTRGRPKGSGKANVTADDEQTKVSS